MPAPLENSCGALVLAIADPSVPAGSMCGIRGCRIQGHDVESGLGPWDVLPSPCFGGKSRLGL